MKVPVSVMIGGRKVRIEYPNEIPGDKPEEPLSGEMVCGTGLIRIAKSQHKTERDVFSTAIHEMLHYTLELTGHSAAWTDAQEEPIVTALENMLAPLLAFNSTASIQYREISWPGEDE